MAPASSLNAPSGYTLLVDKLSGGAGPYSKFYVGLKIYGKNTGSSIQHILKRYIYVEAGTNGFGGTNLTISWGAGSVSLTTTGYYAEYDVTWKDLAYGGTEPVQYKDCYAYYSGSSYYETGIDTFTYTAPKGYTVTYNSNGGSGSMSTDTTPYGFGYVTKANTFTRTGYTWKGWNEASDGSGTDWTSLVGQSWTWTYTKNITLYAQWSPNTYYIYFNANGGTGAPDTQSYTYANSGTTTLSSTKPTKSGYTFIGWGTSTSDTSADWSAGGSYAKSYAGNRTLYAIWRKTITITYNANNGSGAPSAQTGYAYNANTNYTFTISSTKPARTGYTFLGWSTSSSATSANGSYDPGDEVTLSNSITLYAVWQIITYKVSYNANGGSNAPGNQTKTYGETLVLSLDKPVLSGYFFVNWNTKADGTGTSYESGGNYTDNSALTLYAQWEPANVVYYKINGQYVLCNTYGKINGSWKPMLCYGKINGAWIRSTTDE